MKKKKCCCCGNFTLDIDSIFDICYICHWQDDAVQNDDIDYKGGANELSLREARDLYKRIGVSDSIFKEKNNQKKKSFL